MKDQFETSHGYESNSIIHFTGNNLSFTEDPGIHSHSIVSTTDDAVGPLIV